MEYQCGTFLKSQKKIVYNEINEFSSISLRLWQLDKTWLYHCKGYKNRAWLLFAFLSDYALKNSLHSNLSEMPHPIRRIFFNLADIFILNDSYWTYWNFMAYEYKNFNFHFQRPIHRNSIFYLILNNSMLFFFLIKLKFRTKFLQHHI